MITAIDSAYLHLLIDTMKRKKTKKQKTTKQVKYFLLMMKTHRIYSQQVSCISCSSVNSNHVECHILRTYLPYIWMFETSDHLPPIPAPLTLCHKSV